MKVHLLPNFNKPDKGDGGVRRVVDAQRKYLPDFDINVVHEQDDADLTVGHGTIANTKKGVPFVSHSHGLHWSDYPWDNWAHETNRAVIDAMLVADAITVPSQWVKRAFGRGMLRDFRVIYHGIELKEWKHRYTAENYVLWNKPRHDAVSNADELVAIAKRMPDTQFVATIANEKLTNVKECGVLPYEKSKAVIQKAGVYLATARETFGIGTLEALASGVPVAGWRHGGQAEIVIDGYTGYLAEPGNFQELNDCIRRCFERREKLSRNCLDDAAKRWQWKDKIEQYAKLYEETLTLYKVSPKVSVIVTCHNLAPFLNDAIDSVMKQTLRDWECIIVDDASTDKTPEVAQSWQDVDKRVRYVRSDANLKLCGARNLGISKAHGKYIINLDADDALTPDALALLAGALDNNPNLHIAYGSLDLMDDNGGNRRANPFPGKFDWTKQMAHLNQLHYASMMRRSVVESVGGYKERMWRAEDGEFWCRATSFGFRADKVTEETTLVYRIRANSKSMDERKKYSDIDGNWCADFPWAIASSGAQGAAIIKQQNFAIPHAELIPFAAPVIAGARWTIPHYESPQVSVIIPLGAGHERYVIDALDSLVAQTVGQWEAIVIDDTDTDIKEIKGAPYVRLFHTEGKQGAGVARNIGIQEARAPLVLFLDADDTLRRDAIEKMLKRYAKGDAGYVYTDWVIAKDDRTLVPGRANEYNAEAWLRNGQHAVTVLMATEDAKRVNGFDESMPRWEDWDFFIKCGINGICGVRIDEGLFFYREHSGIHREKTFAKAEEMFALLQNRYADYVSGSRKMTPCCGGSKKAASKAAPVVIQNVTPAQQLTVMEKHPDKVLMEFLGKQTGPIPYTVNGHLYYGANTSENRYVEVLWNDAPKLERLNVWRRVPQPPPMPPQAAPIEKIEVAKVEEKPLTVEVKTTTIKPQMAGELMDLSKPLMVKTTTKTEAVEPERIVEDETPKPPVAETPKADYDDPPKKRGRKPKVAK